MPPTITDIPILATPRLILRGHKLEDFEASVAIWSDPVVCRYFHGAPMTREDIWGRLLRTFGMWAAFGYGSWAVEEKESGDYIGRVGVAEVKRGLDPELEGMPEAGWTLAARVHGKGYATEAMQAALAWTDAQLDHPKMFCIIAPENKRSLRVAEKCGFRLRQETVYKNAPTLILTREPR
jgi:RimJ/RimL family protein N-acetyltransferase